MHTNEICIKIKYIVKLIYNKCYTNRVGLLMQVWWWVMGRRHGWWGGVVVMGGRSGRGRGCGVVVVRE